MSKTSNKKTDTRALSAIYKKSLKINSKNIKQILNEQKLPKHLNSEYTKLLESSSSVIIDNWKTKKKYIRTKYIANSFRQNLTKEKLLTLLLLDSMINILDDIIDRKLAKDERVSYIVEFLRSYSIFMESAFDNKQILKINSKYMNKLITLAYVEFHYLKLIKNKNIENSYKEAKTIFITRAMDIDAFVEIALLDKNSKHPLLSKEIIKTARIFRALNILKKDIYDMHFDMKAGQETLVTYIHSKHKKLFNKYFLNVLSEISKMQRGSVRRRTKYYQTNTNFNAMIELESEEIQKLLKY